MNKQTQFVSLNSFLVTFFLQIAGCAVIVYAWKKIWLEKNQITIPNFNPSQQIEQIPQNQMGQSRIKLQFVKETFMKIKKIITHFDYVYIYSNLGFQAYTYLAFQRKILKILIILCILDLCIWIPYLLLFQKIEDFSLIRMNTQNNQNFRTTYTLLTSGIIFYFLYNFKLLLRYQLRLNMVRQPASDLDTTQYRQQIDISILNLMRLRTLNVKILKLPTHLVKQQNRSQLQQKERKQELRKYILNYFQHFLNVQCFSRSKIIELILVPAFGQVLNIEYKLKFAQIKLKLHRQQKTPYLLNLIHHQTQQQLQQIIQMRKKQTKQQIQMKKGDFISAFLVVDRYQAVSLLCDNFKLSTNINPFQIKEEKIYNLQNQTSNYIIQSVPSPKQIIWGNFRYKDSSIYRQIGLNIVCVLILIFISTPSTVLNLIKFPPILSTFMVLITNSLLSFLLSKSVQMQKTIWQSKKQQKQFKFLVFYLSFNIILVSIARGIYNVVQLIFNKGGWAWVQIFDLVYKKVDGYYYCTLFLNQTLSSFWYFLIKPVSLIQNYASPQLFFRSLSIIQNISYGNNDNFQFGYWYALLVVLFTLSIIFTSTIPLIHLFGLIFFLIKFYLDSFTLLAFHKQQTDSLGNMITTVLFMVVIGVVFQIFLVANSLLVQQQYIHTIILYLGCFIGVYIGVYLNKPLLTELDLIVDEKMNKKVEQKHIQYWRQIYEHPVSKVFQSKFFLKE